MILNQVEAAKLSEILKGFSEGKRYRYYCPTFFKVDSSRGIVIPKDFNEITDFDTNPSNPTILLPTSNGALNYISLIKESEKC